MLEFIISDPCQKDARFYRPQVRPPLRQSLLLKPLDCFLAWLRVERAVKRRSLLLHYHAFQDRRPSVWLRCLRVLRNLPLVGYHFSWKVAYLVSKHCSQSCSCWEKSRTWKARSVCSLDWEAWSMGYFYVSTQWCWACEPNSIGGCLRSDEWSVLFGSAAISLAMWWLLAGFDLLICYRCRPP